MGSVCGTRSKISNCDVDDPKPVAVDTVTPATPAKVQFKENDDGDGNGTVYRLLLLGSGESGKTTVLQQIRMLYNQHFSETELIHRRAFIYNNIMNSMRVILNHVKTQGLALQSANEPRCNRLLQTQDECLGPLTQEEFDDVQECWKDAAVQEAYNHRGEYNLNDSAKYFFENMTRINKFDFQPTPTDLIRAYVPTVGIQNLVFTTNKQSFQLFDIGGQRVDRRKWATMYDGLDAILYCIAISEYDQKYEDEEQQSKLDDSLELLEQTCNCDKFADTPIFVYLNEVDVLKEKLDKIPLKNYISDYSGKTEKDALEFLMNKVKERTIAHSSSLTFFEYICAIETDSVAKTLDNMFKKLISLSK